MQASFSLTVDTARHLIKVVLAGFFSADDIERFRVARDAAHRQLTCRPHGHVTIVDIRKMDIQSQDSVNAFRSLIADQRYHGRRIAIVVASSLARSQIKRAAATRGAAYFNDEEAALAWLWEAGRAAA